MGYKYDVFISYSRRDTEVADKICQAFNDVGISYFIDRRGIGGGMEFPAVLAKAIKESKVFLFLASKNSYDSKFTQSEIVYAFNKKQKQDILPYIIDGSTMPDELEFTFSSINWRLMDSHPIDTVLVDDILTKVGKERKPKPVEETSLPADSEEAGSEQDKSNSTDEFLNKYIVGFNFSGKHLAWIILAYSAVMFLVMVFLSKSYIKAHQSTIENVLMISLLIFLIASIIGFIRPASMALDNRKEVLKFYGSALILIFFALCAIVDIDDKVAYKNRLQQAEDVLKTDTISIVERPTRSLSRILCSSQIWIIRRFR